MDDFISREIAEFTRRYKLPAKIEIPVPELTTPPHAQAREVAIAQPMPQPQISKWKLPVIQLTTDPSSTESQSAEEPPDSEIETETESEYESESYEDESSGDDYQQNYMAATSDWIQQLNAAKALAQPKGLLNLILKK